ncbi:MAG: hypothetical protein ABSA01_06540 [Anaerolineales bacterium]|jgi:hypothetical protein
MDIHTRVGAIRDISGMNNQPIPLSSSERVPTGNILDFINKQFSDRNRFSLLREFSETSVTDIAKLLWEAQNSTFAISEQLSRGIFEFIQNLNLYNYTSVLQKETIFEQEVVKTFSDIFELKVIYLERNQSTFSFKIFIMSKAYNDSLMDRLLDRELNLLQNFPNISMEFQYIPYHQDPVKVGAISEFAKQIFIK